MNFELETDTFKPRLNQVPSCISLFLLHLFEGILGDFRVFKIVQHALKSPSWNLYLI